MPSRLRVDSERIAQCGIRSGSSIASRLRKDRQSIPSTAIKCCGQGLSTIRIRSNQQTTITTETRVFNLEAMSSHNLKEYSRVIINWYCVIVIVKCLLCVKRTDVSWDELVVQSVVKYIMSTWVGECAVHCARSM